MNLIKIEVVDYETSVISVERLVLYTNVFLILIPTDIIGTVPWTTVLLTNIIGSGIVWVNSYVFENA